MVINEHKVPLDEREVMPPNPKVTGVVTVAVAHGIEVAVELRPVEHPTEPLDNYQPIQCSLPEPSILNDERIWKERVSAGMKRRADSKEGGTVESETVGTKPRPTQYNCMIVPSLSAPEYNLLNLPEERHASGIYNVAVILVGN